MYHILKADNIRVYSYNTVQVTQIESMFRAILFDGSDRSGEPLMRRLEHVLDVRSVALEAHTGPMECLPDHTATGLRPNAANGHLDLALEIFQTLRCRSVDLRLQLPP